MKISVIGLGKLGSPIVATLASKGFEVIGVDVNEGLVKEITAGKTLLNEPNLAGLLKKYRAKIRATTDTKQAVLGSEMTFIIVPTPSQENGEFSNKYILPVIEKLGEALKEKKSFHLVLVTSTVMPGSTQKFQKILEKISGKKCGQDFGLCYNPEFIALGNVCNMLLNPDFILIGESDKKTGDRLVSFYEKYCDNKPKFARMNYVNAELAKISFNTFVTTKISYANMIAEICEKLPGGNVDAVTGAIGLSSIIGGKYIKGAVGYGGPCFPRDNVAFISLARNLKASALLAESTHKTNLNQLTRLVEVVLRNLQKGESVGILGLSYKPDTDVIEESQSFLLAKQLSEKGIKLNLYDPISLTNVKKFIDKGAKFTTSAKECIESSNIVLVGTNWPEFKKVSSHWFKKTRVLIDPWRMLEGIKFPEDLEYVPFGVYLES